MYVDTIIIEAITAFGFKNWKINVFKLYPLIQEILKYLGTLFLIYLAYKISFSGSKNEENKNKNPVKFIETFVFQFLNPKAVIASIIIVSTYIKVGENFVSYTTQIIILALLVSVTSITSVSYTHLTLPTTSAV